MILPNIVTKIAFTLSDFCKQNTRPPNSPTRFGVKSETVIPKNTALIANQKETFSNFDTKNCHLIASIDQLTSIKEKTIIISK